jgi:antitoxin-like ribbon-helix-helix protein
MEKYAKTRQKKIAFLDEPTPPQKAARRPDREDTGLLQVHLPKATIRALKHLAADEDTTVKALIEKGITHVLTQRGGRT